ncbi:MAG: TauD/TfdA family dioxygenase [Pseudomonadota bacterium]|nr:TauD/TfdA family dioxygenase [Pseudomonadota bacterium]
MISVLPPERGRPYAIIVAEGQESPLDVPESTFVDLYKTYGALLFRSFEVNLETFRTFTSRYCSSSVFNESPDRLLVDRENNIQTVNLGGDPFPLHPELSREPWKPDVCFFWCMSPPSRGGETVVCDGVDIVRNLPRPIYDALKPRRLHYTQVMAPEVCAYWLGSPDPDDETMRNPPAPCPYTFFRINGRVARSFSRPALHKPMFSDDLAFGNFLLFARYYLGKRNFPTFEQGEIVPDELVEAVKAASDPITAPVVWRENDFIVLDNSRFMHGRNAIIEQSERRIASYFGYLKFAVPDAEEIADAPWRREAFRPPQPRRPGV